MIINRFTFILISKTSKKGHTAIKECKYDKVIKLIFTSSKSGKKKFLKVVKDLIRNELDVFLKKNRSWTNKLL